MNTYRVQFAVKGNPRDRAITHTVFVTASSRAGASIPAWDAINEICPDAVNIRMGRITEAK